MRRPRVLLLWPGTLGAAAGNFGVPQLVGLASFVQARTGAEVHVRDLVAERALLAEHGRALDPSAIFDGDGDGYDVVGISVYSSYDWLVCEELAKRARARLPDAVLVAGGYHASARPAELLSVFDVVVVGEGELPLTEVVEAVQGGVRLTETILGPSPIFELDTLPETDWSLLSRYRGVARKVASQAQLYLSRGCPFDCAFCMERAKREVSWRSFSVERAVAEVLALHRFLDLRSWTLYVADALFGMKTSWRRSFLAELARHDVPVDKIWLLIRIDLVEDQDLELFAAANCGLGFGLESGDPAQLAIIRKAGRLDTYLDRMKDVAGWALRRNVPWGANVIVGHPGETEASIARSAAYLRELFLGPARTTGFLSVDPFRIYPGSPIDGERGAWEVAHGTRFWAAGGPGEPTWWHEGDPELLSEWVDPSGTLDYLTRERLQHEHLQPILDGIEPRFAYEGPGRDYFVRTLRQQARLSRGRATLLDRHFAWRKWTGRSALGARERRAHPELGRLFAERRKTAIDRVVMATSAAPALRAALEAVPRERFVPLDRLMASTRDEAIPLGEGASVSAMHAYVRTATLLGLREGQRVLDLGAGTGYGAALYATLVGPSGRVRAVEIDPALAATAEDELAALGLGVEVRAGDALDPSHWTADLDAVAFGFALAELPLAAIGRLRPGTVVVVPVGGEAAQRLTRVVAGPTPEITVHDEVRYVPRRDAPPLTPTPREPARRLPVL